MDAITAATVDIAVLIALDTVWNTVVYESEQPFVHQKRSFVTICNVESEASSRHQQVGTFVVEDIVAMVRAYIDEPRLGSYSPSPWMPSVSVTYNVCSSGEKQRPFGLAIPSATALTSPDRGSNRYI